MEKHGYIVTDVTQRSSLTPSGGFEDIYSIHFVTESGVRDVLEVKASKYLNEPDAVLKELSSRAQIHAIIKPV